jgi:hypothetical protein
MYKDLLDKYNELMANNLRLQATIDIASSNNSTNNNLSITKQKNKRKQVSSEPK